MTAEFMTPQSLCRRCGLCCNGTLLVYVPVEAEELRHHAAHWAQAGIQVEAARIDLPCGAWQDHGCACYAHRPQMCAAFQCKLLWQFENGQLAPAEVERIMDFMQQQIQALGAKLRETPADVADAPFHERLRRFRDYYRDLDLLSREACAHLMVEQRALLLLMTRHFGLEGDIETLEKVT